VLKEQLGMRRDDAGFDMEYLSSPKVVEFLRIQECLTAVAEEFIAYWNDKTDDDIDWHQYLKEADNPSTFSYLRFDLFCMDAAVIYKFLSPTQEGFAGAVKVVELFNRKNTNDDYARLPIYIRHRLAYLFANGHLDHESDGTLLTEKNIIRWLLILIKYHAVDAAGAQAAKARQQLNIRRPPHVQQQQQQQQQHSNQP
jgi:hypothetical protein